MLEPLLMLIPPWVAELSFSGSDVGGLERIGDHFQLWATVVPVNSKESN